MIYERDLDEAIAVCQGERNPDAKTCLKLAAYLTLKRELFEQKPPEQSYYYANGPVETISQTIEYDGDTDFARAIDGKGQADIWPVIDEMMTTVQVLYPKLYDAVMRKLQE